MKIKEINKIERPKERLIKLGKSYLSDYELLAIILNSGTKKEGVIEIASKILNNYNLLDITYDELIKIDGIKQSKATRIIAFIELTKRLIQKSNLEKNLDLSNSYNIYSYSYLKFINLKYEKIIVLFLDIKLNLIYEKEFENFLENKININIKEIIKLCIIKNSKNIIIIHNHPSGSSKPSKEDLYNTNKIIDILKSFEINLIEHLIIGKNEYFSIIYNKLIKL